LAYLISVIKELDDSTLYKEANQKYYEISARHLFECAIGTISVITAPHVTAFVGKLLGKSILPKNQHNNILHHLRFSMTELEDEVSFGKGIDRILQEEPHDQERIGTLYGEMGNEKKADSYKLKAEEIRKYCNALKQFYEQNIDEQNRGTPQLKKLMEDIYKLKRSTILGESFIEGGIWGSFGLTIRAFRKYVLGQERFTGTKGYLSDSESE